MRVVWAVLVKLAIGLVAIHPAWADEVSRRPGGVDFRSGYNSVPALGGPNSTNSALRLGDAEAQDYYRFSFLRDRLDPYYAFKKRLNDRFGLAVGMDSQCPLPEGVREPGQ